MILSSLRIRYERGYNVREMEEDRLSCRRVFSVANKIQCNKCTFNPVCLSKIQL